MDAKSKKPLQPFLGVFVILGCLAVGGPLCFEKNQLLHWIGMALLYFGPAFSSLTNIISMGRAMRSAPHLPDLEKFALALGLRVNANVKGVVGLGKETSFPRFESDDLVKVSGAVLARPENEVRFAVAWPIVARSVPYRWGQILGSTFAILAVIVGTAEAAVFEGTPKAQGTAIGAALAALIASAWWLACESTKRAAEIDLKAATEAGDRKAAAEFLTWLLLKSSALERPASLWTRIRLLAHAATSVDMS